MSVAFALSGGASLGAIQVAMLRALVDRGVRPDAIVGTSVGALSGAFLACRDFTDETVDELAAVWRHVRRGEVFPLAPVSGVLGVLGARSSLVPSGSLRHLVLRHVPCERLEDLPTPLHVIACDLRTGEELRLTEGPLVDGRARERRASGRVPAGRVERPPADRPSARPTSWRWRSTVACATC